MKRKMLLIAAVVGLMAVSGWVLHGQRKQAPTQGNAPVAQPPGPPVPPYYADLDGVTIPKTLAPSAFSDQAARKGYEIARKIPKVLMQMPCYCQCQVMGHKSLLDCFTSKHAASCDICLDSASFVYKQLKAGVPIAKIRQQLIDRNSLAR